MNRQTSKLLTILLNSPGQYFHYEELAARFHVSTRSIRNYVQSILEFLEDQNLQPVLSVSEGGIAFTGGAVVQGFPHAGGRGHPAAAKAFHGY